MTTIPEELRTRPQWVTWKHIDGTKRPFNAKTGKLASSTNSKTWATYDEAVAAAAARGHDGIGYVFAEDDPYVGVDLDDCLENDAAVPWAQTIIESLHSYTEISPSGSGVKIWVKGSIPSSVKTAQVEIYNRARFFTVTGRRYDDAPLSIAVANGALDTLHQQYAKPQPQPQPERMTTKPVDDAYLRAWADRIIDTALDKMRQAGDGERHNTRLAMGRLLGGLIPYGLMSEERAERLLYDANVPDGNHQGEAKAIRDGIAFGRSAPLDVPEPPPQPVFDSEQYACCPEHERRLVKGRSKGYYCPARDASTVSGWCDFWWKGDGYIEPNQTDTAGRKINPLTGEILEEAKPLSWKDRGVTLAQLQHKQFEPERWIVENILPEGACLLAAKYKSKKSWLSLALGLAVAMGGKALGRLNVSQGRVLLLDLEGKQQRIQKRARSILGVRNVPWPENFHIFTEWPQGDDGMRELENWLANYPDTALVIIDVLADFRRPIDRFEAPYQYDRDTVQPINALCEKYHAACIIVHHLNKAKNDDIMDSISGTTGLPSAVNTMWGLARDVNDSNITIMHMRGRDLENDDPIALKWDHYINCHVIEGPAAEIATTGERRAILNVLGDDTPRTPKEIASEVGKTVESVKQLLRKLLNEGLIDKAGYGKYARIPDHAGTKDHDAHTDHSDHSGNSEHPIFGKSDRQTPRVIPPDHSVLTQQDALNSKSDQSDRFERGGIFEGDNETVKLFLNVPITKRTTLRLYLRSQQESDQARARDLCEEYGIDYDAAWQEVNRG